jgi:hypothetical protein
MAAQRPRVTRPGRPGARRSSGRRYVLLLALIIGLGTAWGVYELGQSRAGYNRFAAQARERELREQLIDLQTEGDRLREQVALLETDARIKGEAYRRLETDLVTLQDQIQSLSEDLAFYQGIVSVDEKEGLRVQDLVIASRSEPGAYTLSLVLAQALRKDRRISGSLELAVEGQLDNGPRSLGLAEISPDGAARLDFSFRYFQNLESELRMPAGFAPEKLTVTLRPKGKNAKPVEQVFSWRVQGG